MAFTETYCNASTGANVNGGSDAGSPSMSDTAGTGTYLQGGGATDTYTSAATNGAVAVGQFLSIYSGAATIAAFTGRITAVSGGSGLAWVITVSNTAFSGTRPANAGTYKAQVGGAWKGPNGASGFPFDYVTAALTNVGGDTPRINFKNTATYTITGGILANKNGPIRYEAYTTTIGDGGMATIDGGSPVSDYILLTASGTNTDFVGFVFQNNGTSDGSQGANGTGAEQLWLHCVFTALSGAGLGTTGASIMVVECEAYGNGLMGGGGVGFNITGAGSLALRCIAHDNTATGMSGFAISAGMAKDCIADTNSSSGFRVTSTVGASLVGCDAYNNTSDGFTLANTAAAIVYMENCNAIKNGGWGINGSGAGARNGQIYNCGFGAGTQANSSGTTTGLKSIVESGSVTYASNVTPWVDPANGDFRINLAAAIGTGRGAFTETAASYAGTVGAPVIGAAQVADYPATSNVALGISYANGAYVGTSTTVVTPTLPGRVPVPGTGTPLPGRI